MSTSSNGSPPEHRRLKEDYEIVRSLGRGSQGESLLVRPPDSERQLVAKSLWLGPIDDWKTVELFERSADLLQQIDHPGVPSYVDHLVGGEDKHGTPETVLIREYVEGKSLLDHLEEGWRPTEEELLELADQLLDILAHLHERSPPIVHRDIKPANIIRSPDGERFHLVDFGTAQARVLDEVGGSTMAGTTGYVPFEQLSGRAGPASDLFALGQTLIHAASHTHPSELPSTDFRVDFRDHVDLSTPLSELLWDLTQPRVDDRLASARRAADRIDEIRRPDPEPRPQKKEQEEDLPPLGDDRDVERPLAARFFFGQGPDNKNDPWSAAGFFNAIAILGIGGVGMAFLAFVVAALDSAPRYGGIATAILENDEIWAYTGFIGGPGLLVAFVGRSISFFFEEVW
jgi:serine/threonine protein kinase